MIERTGCDDVCTYGSAYRNRSTDTVPFSLTCLCCDFGEHIGSIEQARSEGWTDIAYEDGVGWNFIGECPDCRAMDSQTVNDDE